MLITFRVSNFLSFDAETEISLLKGKARHPESHVFTFGEGRTAVGILKFAMLYGANASGKSNLVKAIDFGKNAIVIGLKKTLHQPLYFRLADGKKSAVSKFEFEFELDGKMYAYGFEIYLDKNEIAEEWLFELKKTTDKPIFIRKTNLSGHSEVDTKPDFSGGDKTRFSIYAEDIGSDELLLHVLGQKSWPTHSPFSVFAQIYDWFNDQLVIIYPDTHFSIFELGPENIDFFCAQLKRFNVGITGIHLGKPEKADEVLEKLPLEVRTKLSRYLDKGRSPFLSFAGKRIVFSRVEEDIYVQDIITEHKKVNAQDPVYFQLDMESDGTGRLFDLISLLDLLSKSPTTVIIDEIDRSLHPQLTKELIVAMASLSVSIASQLIATTHETRMLDLSLLRRDEIWFVEKSEDGASRLFSLEEFKPRFDKELRSAYLQGRFGGVPFIPSIQYTQSHESKALELYAEG